MIRTVVLLASALSLAFAPAPFPRPDSSKSDLQKMQGEWTQVKFAVAGKPDTVRDFLVVVSGKRMKWVLAGKPFVEWAISLDGTKKPKEFDARGVAGSVKGALFRGVYRLEGDTLTICYRAGERPTGIDSDKPSVWREQFRRVKR
jgi:uncharacterized protein (TIGR03067 family)